MTASPRPDDRRAPSDRPRPLRRSDHGVLAGVATGIAEYANIDPVITRLAFVLGLVFSGGTVALLYLALWIVMPGARATESSGAGERRDYSAARLVGWMLIAVGGVLLLNRLALVDWWGIDIFSYSWPVLLIVFGVWVLLAGRARGGR